MFDWNEAVKRAIGDLGGQTRLVTGARLRVQLNATHGKDELDLFIWQQRPRKFIQLVREVPGIQFEPRPRSDFLVGFPGAQPPSADERPSRAQRQHRVPLRSDVFAAFTKAATKPYKFLPDRDLFTNDYSESEAGVVVPPQTLDTLRAQRREFAVEKVENASMKERLIEAVDISVNPLSEFMTRVTELGLSEDWRQFKYERIVDAIRQWATANQLTFSPSWYAQRGEVGGSLDSPQAILARIAQFMTDDEIQALTIPFAAVQKMVGATRREP